MMSTAGYAATGPNESDQFLHLRKVFKRMNERWTVGAFRLPEVARVGLGLRCVECAESLRLFRLLCGLRVEKEERCP